MTQNLPVTLPDKRLALAAATMAGTAYAAEWRALPRPGRATYTPEVFGYLVGSVLARYTPEEHNAFRIGFLAAMREDGLA